MRKLLFCLLMLSAVVISCNKTISPAVEKPTEYTANLEQAKKWFNGSWKLTRVKAQISNPAVPNVQLVISGNQITVMEDGKQIDKVDFKIVETDHYFQLITNAEPRADNWYVRNPVVQISESRMYLDTGTFQDMPGFTFEKLK